MRLFRISGIAIAALLLACGNAHADMHYASAEEMTTIHHYKTVVNGIFDGLAAQVGWKERMPNHMDIGGDQIQIITGPNEPFYFDGDVSRMYEGPAPADPQAAQQALMQRLQKARTAAERSAIIADYQKLMSTPQDDVQNELLIGSQHNMAYFATDQDQPQPMTAPPGVAMAYVVHAYNIKGAKAVVLEFGDPAAMVRSDADQRTDYHYVHADNSPHIEQMEIRLEGPPAVVDNLVATYNWRKVNAALVP